MYFMLQRKKNRCQSFIYLLIINRDKLQLIFFNLTYNNFTKETIQKRNTKRINMALASAGMSSILLQSQ
jgi:hypothetical protein